VLVVCTANVCRSPAAARLLSDLFGAGVRVHSAGVHAEAGQPACADASGWLRQHSGMTQRGRHRAAGRAAEHASRLLTADDVRAASLVLTAAREHRAAVARLAPASQVYTFTLAQAGRIAAWRSLQEATPPRSTDGRERLAWLVHELDAGRGEAPRSAEDADDDIPDPHLDAVSHEVVMRQLDDAVHSLALLLSGDPFWAAPTGFGRR
jgi:protein-tyrosine phosphatase